MDTADLNDYRIALAAMPDERLVTELCAAHYEYLTASSYASEERGERGERFKAAKEAVLKRMDYEKKNPAK